MIKLPASIYNLEQLQGLIGILESSTDNKLSLAFWQTNPDLDKDDRMAIAKQLRDLLGPLNSVTVTLAQFPDAEMLQFFVEKIRKAVGKQVLVELEVDPMIVGGMVLRTPQHIYDMSLSKVLLATKPRLKELIYAS